MQDDGEPDEAPQRQSDQVDMLAFMQGTVHKPHEGTVIEESEEVVIEVLTPNMLYFRVFRVCKMNIQVGMAVVWLGITAQEARSACKIVGVPKAEREEVVLAVQYMGDVVADAANTEARKKAAAYSKATRPRGK